MKLIKADFDRRLALPGVPGLVQRPVDIDTSRTDFANLRSLRIYRFDAGCTIDGHAEEDEVFVVVMSGSIQFTASEFTAGGDSSGESRMFALSAAEDGSTEPSVAYLPPHAAYKLVPQSDAEVAYARATPPTGNPAKVFAPSGRMDADGVSVLLEERAYAKRLHLRLMQVNAAEGEVEFAPVDDSDALSEALVHVRIRPTDSVATIMSNDDDPIRLESWDTLAVAPGDHPMLRIPGQSSALVLVVAAI